MDVGFRYFSNWLTVHWFFPQNINVLDSYTTEKIAAISYSQVLISVFTCCGSVYLDFFGFGFGFFFGGGFGCCLILVPYKYAVGGRCGLFSDRSVLASRKRNTRLYLHEVC